MSRSLDFDPFVHPPLQAEQRDRLRAEGAMGPEERELSFDQVLDVINPLHHIPVVGTLYRALTGDQLDGSASIMGSMIYGGPVGLVAGLVDAVVEQASGRDIGGLALAMIGGEELAGPAAAVQTAAAAASDVGSEIATAGAVAVAAAASPGSGSRAAQPSPGPAEADPAPAPATPEAPLPNQPSTSATAPARPAAGTMLEGADALSALAADLRAAVARTDETGAAMADGVRRPRRAEGAPAPATARPATPAPAALGSVPPAESFMPLTPRELAGPELASQISTEHAAGSGPLPPRQPGLYPASLGRTAGRGQQAVEPGVQPIAPGLRSDSRFSGGIAPQANFTDRMMEALTKYQALSGVGG